MSTRLRMSVYVDLAVEMKRLTGLAPPETGLT